MRAGTRRTGGDTGAVAVEFALLFPIFAALTLGAITVGTAFFHNIAITNATREAARFGATLQIADPAVAGSVEQDQWLVKVAEIAIRSGGWSLPANMAVVSPTLPRKLADNGYVCVSYVRGAEGLTFPTRSLTFMSNTLTGVYANAACVDPDGIPTGTYDPKRVQVVLQRNAVFEAVDDSGRFLLDSQTVITYERGAT